MVVIGKEPNLDATSCANVTITASVSDSPPCKYEIYVKIKLVVSKCEHLDDIFPMRFIIITIVFSVS